MAFWTPTYVVKANSKIQSVYTGSYEAAKQNNWADKLISTVPVESYQQINDMMIETLTITEESGRETLSDLKSKPIVIESKRFSGGFKIREIDFLSLPQMASGLTRYTEAAGQLGAEAALFGQRLGLKFFANGLTTNGLDGVPFFSASHPTDFSSALNGTYTNYETAKALTAENFAAAVAQLETRVMPNGTSRNLRAKYLFHSPQLKLKAREVTGAQFLAKTGGGTSSNVLVDYDVIPVSVPGLPAKWWGVMAENVSPSGINRAIGIGVLQDFSIADFSDITSYTLRQSSELACSAKGHIGGFYAWPYLIHLCVEP
ncbi:MAG: Mu-like prophage major head subunit gpT family protein [Labilithrix sp.]|nr:Mu-like prophage major head subunit gpT family protein [Labilithrix sp.]